MALAVLAGLVPTLYGVDSAEVVSVTARAFEYSPAEIHLKKDRAVILELRSQDLFHGFNIPDLGVRADLPPGQSVRIALTPRRSGVFAFHCDNFCGSGHEQMSGRIIVEE
jgi:cytochrome c oxidase subunit 2